MTDSKSILILEDEPASGSLLCKIIRDLGLTPILAEHGKAALKILNKIHKHKKLKRIPIVIITGEVGLNKAGMFLDKGVKAFLNKPVNKQDIEKVLRQYVKGMENTEPIESL
jgi:CheY-like chemotaxis protein